MDDTQCPDFSFHFCNFRHCLPLELMNRKKVAVGGLGFVFALNVFQHHRLGIATFFSMVSVVMIDVHGCLVGEMCSFGCQMSEVVRQGCTKGDRSKRAAHGAGRLRRSELGYGFF